MINENRFCYHFQPIVSTSDGEIYSYEALMRPQSTLCPSPYQIIKYAEMTRRLNEIERATFFNILGIIDIGKEKFRGRRVFINSIPGTRFSAEDAARVRMLLERHSDTAVVEMTEYAEMSDSEIGRIRDMYRHMGVQTALDDYGTGYSKRNCKQLSDSVQTSFRVIILPVLRRR